MAVAKHGPAWWDTSPSDQRADYRAELMAVVQVLERTTGRVTVVTDSKAVQTQASEGLKGVKQVGVKPREHHVDLWRRFKVAVQDRGSE